MNPNENQPPRQVTGLESFYDSLYEQGNPDLASSSAEEPLSPLYDSLRSVEDRYMDQTLIARGGMKEIFLTYDRLTSRHVALAKPSRKLGKDHYDSFLREAHLTARLEHPCIINLFGMGVDDNARPYFTMEYKRGHSLRKILKDYKSGNGQEAWPIKRRIAILLKICEGLAYAHSRRVLHLDLKPENIQVGSYGEVQICDWGLGVVMQGESQKLSEVLLDPDLYGSMQRQIEGTAQYMAPEQFDPKTIKTPQMDIYALGCIMDEIVRATPEQSGKNTSQLKDSTLLAIIEKAKATDPAYRYREVDEMRRDLERYDDGYSSSAENSSIGRELALFYRRNKQASNITLTSLLVLLGAAFIFFEHLKISRDNADMARIAAEKAQRRAETLRAREKEAKTQAVQALESLKEANRISQIKLQQQAETTLRSNQLVDDFLNDRADLESVVATMLREFDTVTSNDISDQHRIWNQLFFVHFLTQNFAQALEIHHSGKRTDSDLIPLAKAYSSQGGPTSCLSDDAFLSLLRDLTKPPYRYNRSMLAEKMVHYDQLNEREPTERAKFVKQLLLQNNPRWAERHFDFRPESGALTIRGRNFFHLSHRSMKDNPARCLLRFLDPKSLDLSSTDFWNLSILSELRLMELDIRDTDITSLAPLREMRSLRQVIVSPGQLSTENELPPSVTLVIK
ncbi:MAG: serine/threonine-protein kinase [Verrucomicrobiota bacterium JB023]|nr:serine/threonine-protein kinase [Verrucomicrobiota bacterium JB023]